MLYQEGRGLEILTTTLTVQVSTIAVGVGVTAIVAIAVGGDILRKSTHAGQQSQEGSKKNELKHTCHLIPWQTSPFTKMGNIFRVFYHTYLSMVKFTFRNNALGD
jgi:hypothetical protein